MIYFCIMNKSFKQNKLSEVMGKVPIGETDRQNDTTTIVHVTISYYPFEIHIFERHF